MTHILVYFCYCLPFASPDFPLLSGGGDFLCFAMAFLDYFLSRGIRYRCIGFPWELYVNSSSSSSSTSFSTSAWGTSSNNPSTDRYFYALFPPLPPPPGSPLSSSSSRISSLPSPPPLIKRGLRFCDLPYFDSDTLFRELIISPLGGILPGSWRSRDDKFPEGLI